MIAPNMANFQWAVAVDEVATALCTTGIDADAAFANACIRYPDDLVELHPLYNGKPQPATRTRYGERCPF